MIVVLQRVARAAVRVQGRTVAAIGPGLCLLCCAVRGDSDQDAAWLAEKLAHLRVFPDQEGRTQRSAVELGGEALVVPQFTLAADWRRGRRPGFGRAAEPEQARRLLEVLAERLTAAGLPARSGRFGALMALELVNDGPFTLVLDSEARARAS